MNSLVPLASDGAAVDVVVMLGSCTGEADGGLVVAVDYVSISLVSDEGVSACLVQPESIRMFKTNIVAKAIKNCLPALRRSVIQNATLQIHMINNIAIVRSCIVYFFSNLKPLSQFFLLLKKRIFMLNIA